MTRQYNVGDCVKILPSEILRHYGYWITSHMEETLCNQIFYIRSKRIYGSVTEYTLYGDPYLYRITSCWFDPTFNLFIND